VPGATTCDGYEQDADYAHEVDVKGITVDRVELSH